MKTAIGEKSAEQRLQELNRQRVIEQKAALDEYNREIAIEAHARAEVVRRGTKWRMIQLTHSDDKIITDPKICADIREYAPPEAFVNVGMGVMILPGFSMLEKPPQTSGYDATRGGENFVRPFGFTS
jgi:hypothetical protein